MAEAFDVPPSEAMVLSAVYVLFAHLLGPPDALDAERMGHAGGAGLIPDPDDRLFADDAGHVPDRTRLLEVVGWQCDENIVAMFGIDAETDALAHIRVTDKGARVEATIRVRRYATVGDRRLPAVLDVTIGERRYREEWTAWDLSP